MKLQDILTRHPEHSRRALAIRALAMDAVEAAKSGHPGMPMGLADVATVLFEKHLKFDAAAPNWPDRDRFVLSAGHGSMLLYALLHLTGYKDFTIDQLKNFRQLGSITAGHPEFGHGAGIETTTGPLGQGLANAVGMAIAEEHQRKRFGSKVVNHHTYVIAGDGCLMEGISHEAAGLAGNLALSRLVVLFDDNGITIDGRVELSDSTDQLARFQSYGWDTLSCDGHDPDSIDQTLSQAKQNRCPTLIACKTTIGFGSPNKQGTASAHGSPLGESEITLTKSACNWPYGAFEIPDVIREEWLSIGKRGQTVRQEWLQRLEELPISTRRKFESALKGELPRKFAHAINGLKKTLVDESPKVATRKASQRVLQTINPILPDIVGGSADLTGSNNTWTDDLGVFSANNRNGRYLHYGIREHAMAAAMNGMKLHGGVRPYGGTFLCFSDYARPAIRLAALMKLPVIFVMTHDSIGLGEDGPTHQPVEHLAMLRATPNLNVFRPADAIETAEAWQLALSETDKPSVIALTRQSLPTLRNEFHGTINQTKYGAYVMADTDKSCAVVLLASGSEVAVAMEAKHLLEQKNIGTRVVSVPCFELFAIQTETYRKRLLPRGAVRVATEAGVQNGWDRWLCTEGIAIRRTAFIGMDGFGASAPAPDLFAHFGITAQKVAEQAEALL